MAKLLPGIEIAIKVEPWTKENLRVLGKHCFDYAATRSRDMFLAGRGALGCEWGSRLPRIERAIAAIAHLPYETGKDVDAIGATFIDLMLESTFDPASIAEKYTGPPCSACGREIKRKRHVGRDGAAAYCSAFCASDHGSYVNPASITGVTRAFLAASVEFAPIGTSPRYLIAKVADHLGIGVDPSDLRER